MQAGKTSLWLRGNANFYEAVGGNKSEAQTMNEKSTNYELDYALIHSSISLPQKQLKRTAEEKVSKERIGIAKIYLDVKLYRTSFGKDT